MFTVILYKNHPDFNLEKYKFVYLNFQMEGQLVLCEWSGGMSDEAVAEELELFTRDCEEWKLVVLDWWCDTQKNTIDQEMRALVQRICCPSHSGHSIEGRWPVWVWYVGCRTPNINIPCICNEYYRSFRQFEYCLNTDSGTQKQYDLFRLNCILLVLSVNDIPAAFLEKNAVYHLNLEISRQEFVEYILLLEQRLEQIGNMLEQEKEKLQQLYETRVDYQEPPMFEANFEREWEKIEAEEEKAGLNKSEELDKWDIKSMQDVRQIIETKRRFVRSRLYFPQGVMRGKMNEIREQIDALPEISNLLSESGMDRTKREKQEAMEGMCREHSVQEVYLKYEKDIQCAEKDLIEQGEQAIWLREKLWLVSILLIVEGMIVLPFIFGLKLWEHTQDFKSIMGNIVWLLLIGIVAISFCLLIQIMFQMARWKYRRLIEIGIASPQKKKLKYLEEMTKRIAGYQYCQRLLEEHEERMEELDKRKALLMHHTHIHENSKAMCHQLKRLMNGSEKRTATSKQFPVIDFDMDPKEIEYYWVPYRGIKHLVELNGTGLQFNAFFPFISRIEIRRLR